MTDKNLQGSIKFLLEEKENLKRNKSIYDKKEYERLLHNLSNHIWRLKNPDKEKEAGRKFRLKNSERECERVIDWRLKNPEKYKNILKKYRLRHPEKIKDMWNNWFSLNWEKAKLNDIYHNEIKRDIKTIITEHDIIDIINNFKGECFKCGTIHNLEFDHFYPLKYKIPISKENCVILCRSCNAKKSKKDPEEFFNKKQLKKLYNEYGITKVEIKENNND